MNLTLISRRDFLRIAMISMAGGLLAACKKGNGNEDVTQEVEAQVTVQQKRTIVASPTSFSTLPASRVNVLATGLDFPEGPAFDSQGILWCTELLGGNLVKWSDGNITRYVTGGRPNGLVFDRLGRAYVCDSGINAIRRFDPTAEKWETLVDRVDNVPLQAPNDLCFDAVGNLLFTCPNFADTQPTGYICCFKPDGTIKKIAEGMYRPNGLEFVEGGRGLVVADTYRKTLFKGDWDSDTLTWNKPRLWVIVGGREGPDGMCFGQDELLYQAIYGDGVIKVIDMNGKVLQALPVPGSNPTNVAVDPTGKLGLVVTEAEKGQILSLPDYQPGSSVFDGGEAWK